MELNYKPQTGRDTFLSITRITRLASFLVMMLFIASCSQNAEEELIAEQNLNSEETLISEQRLNSEETLIGERNVNTTSVVAREEGDSCFSDFEGDLSDCFFWGGNLNVTVDQYPGCTFTVDYAYYQCTDPSSGYRTYYIEAVTLIGHDCVDYDNDVLLAQQNGTLAQFSLDFDKLLYTAVSDHLGEPQGGIFGASVVKFNIATCVQYCHIKKSFKGIDVYTFIRMECGTGCCAVETIYDSEGSDTFIATDLYNLEECNVGQQNFCGPGSLISDCIFRCDSFL